MSHVSDVAAILSVLSSLPGKVISVDLHSSEVPAFGRDRFAMGFPRLTFSSLVLVAFAD